MQPDVSQELINEQIDQERLQIHVGKSNLRQNTMKSENKAYASSSVYGVTSIQELIPHVETAVEGIGDRLRKGQAGAAFREIHDYLRDIEPLVAAGIACKIVFDKVFSVKDPDDNLLVSVYEAVGTAVMQECQMRRLRKRLPSTKTKSVRFQ